MLDSHGPESRHLLCMDDTPERTSDSEWKREDSLEDTIGEDDESRYPPFKTVIVSVICIYAAMFLAALVSNFSPC